MDKKRICSLDLVRVFACICVCVVHFNATVSGWNTAGGFVYPNSIVPNYYLENRLYLGDIGVSLFFMLTGASLMLTYREGNLKTYYKKRFMSIYPMFWTAYVAAHIYDFLAWKGVPSGGIREFILSIFCMDGYFSMIGLLAGGPFYKLGEWFLGALIPLYIIFPLLHKCLKRKPLLTCIGAGLCYWGYTQIIAPKLGLRLQSHLFFLRIPEILMGMLFIRYDMRHKPICLLAVTSCLAILAFIFRNHIFGLTLCVCICALLFVVLICLGEKFRNYRACRFLEKAGRITYPVFLVHHWLIDRLSIGFDLANLGRRNTLMLFFVYALLTIGLAKLLTVCSNQITVMVSSLLPQENGKKQ